MTYFPQNVKSWIFFKKRDLKLDLTTNFPNTFKSEYGNNSFWKSSDNNSESLKMRQENWKGNSLNRISILIAQERKHIKICFALGFFFSDTCLKKQKR